jgi:hypothetical protein
MTFTYLSVVLLIYLLARRVIVGWRSMMVWAGIIVIPVVALNVLGYEQTIAVDDRGYRMAASDLDGYVVILATAAMLIRSHFRSPG